MQVNSKRVESADAMRVIAMLAIIHIHSPLKWGKNGMSLDSVANLDQLARFAVPVFFIISGYFWAAGCSVASDYWRRSVAIGKRGLGIFLFWSLLYGLETAIQVIMQEGWSCLVQHMVSALHSPDVFLFADSMLQGSKIHLWFLPALVCAALISGFLLARGCDLTLFLLALLLFIVGLAGGAYANAPLGFRAGFNFRDGPFFSLIMFASGYAIHRYGNDIALLRTGIALALGGFALQHLESNWIQQNWSSGLTHDYVVGTYFFGLGVSMIALSNTRLLRIRLLIAAGRLIPGMYASHFLFVERSHWLRNILQEPHLREIIYIALVFILSLTTSLLLSRWKFTRQFVV